jgi:acyl-CoA synthetase (AMP-forming)/AMP-acid ligase II
VSVLVERFADVVRAEPCRPLIHGAASGAVVRAADIWDAHVRYSGRLAEAGVGPRQTVLSSAGNHPAAVGLLLACREVDAALLAVDAGTTFSEIVDLAERFDVAALVLPEPMCRGGLTFEIAASAELVTGLHVLTRRTRSRRTYPGAAVLKLTSGTTGATKATLTSEAQLIADGTHIITAMGIRPTDTQIAAIPVSHSYGLGNLLMPLLLQGTAIVLRDAFIPQQLPDDARRYATRIFPGVPFMFEYFIAHPPPDGWPACLTHLISAGAPLSPATVRGFHDRFGIKIHSFYGASETGGITFDDTDVVHDTMMVGRPLPGVTLTLDPEDGMPPNTGRIHVRSGAVASGYSDDARGGFDGDGFLTGDYGAVDATNQLTLLGRVSSFVNVAGRKVQPDEVEQLLRTMPGVVDVRVLAAPDARRGQQIVACIVAGADGVSPLAVRQYCASRLAAFKIPRSVIFLDAIPTTSRGKTDRTALDALVRERLADSQFSL